MKKHYQALPKKIKIGQRVWRITVRAESNDAELSRAWAYTYSAADRIVVQSDLTAGKLRAILLHEVLHAIRMTFDNGFAEVEKQGEDESRTSYVERWEHFFINLYQDHLLMVLRDNPTLASFFLMDAHKPL